MHAGTLMERLLVKQQQKQQQQLEQPLLPNQGNLQQCEQEQQEKWHFHVTALAAINAELDSLERLSRAGSNDGCEYEVSNVSGSVPLSNSLRDEPPPCQCARSGGARGNYMVD